MNNNFDSIAKHYDFISRLVYRKAQVNAQIDQLNYIPENSHILIAGGGTGWILEEITKRFPKGLSITYVELSAAMIQLSKARNVKENKVTFLQQGIEAFETMEQFDLILTPFFFDLFTEEKAGKIFTKLDRMLAIDGLWFIADFSLTEKGATWWKQLLIKTMYLFFKTISNIEASSLVNIDLLFNPSYYMKIAEQLYYSKFIKASIYRKIR